MKQLETTFRNIVMILTFVYSGILLIAFIIFFITFLRDGSLFLVGRFAQQGTGLLVVKWIAGFLSIITGMGVVVSFLAGLALLRGGEQTIIREMKVVETRDEEKVENKVEKVKAIEDKVKQEVDGDVLMDDEKKIIKILEEHEGAMTQRDLGRESGLSKVKVHRVLKGLESKKIITKYDFGMTKRIRLEKRLKA